jgi:hypothetical protein
MNLPFPNSGRLPGGVPQIGGEKSPPAFQFIIQVTDELKARIEPYTVKMGLTYAQVLNMLLEFGLTHLNIMISNAENAAEDAKEDAKENGPAA